MDARVFTRLIEIGALLAAVACLAGCPPEGGDQPVAASNPNDDGSHGEYLAASNKLFDKDVRFDIRWKVKYESQENSFDPTINVDNRQLTFNRCNRCHECGFTSAFDLAHYSTKDWHPRYHGQEWANPIYRMQAKDNSFLNDALCERIYKFLREETSTGYDFGKDTKGAVTIEVDPKTGKPVKTTRAKTAQP